MDSKAMWDRNSHLSDRDLVLAIDGEISRERGLAVREHLALCPSCRERMSGIEGTIAGFAEAHRPALDSRVPPSAGPRALLKARLADAGTRSRFTMAERWSGYLGQYAPRRSTWLALAGILLLAFTIGIRVAPDMLDLGSAPLEWTAAPSPRLTPGETIALTKEDICRADSPSRERVVPAALQREVFAEYGIANPSPGAYEVDYLITPELGGATSLRNLWPQPYYHTTWHARIKDQLEDRLHVMVCSGEIDLATAQHEIATNWIAAYKKYFHTQRPLMRPPDRSGAGDEPRSERLLAMCPARPRVTLETLNVSFTFQ
jgi:hypothetical protein